MKTLTVRQRLVLMIVIPVLALLAIIGHELFSEYRHYQLATLTRNGLHIATEAGPLIHALQLERGATAGFIQSKGQKFADVLPKYRTEADNSNQIYTSTVLPDVLAEMPLFGNAYKDAQAQMSSLADLRHKIDQTQIPAADAIATYNKIIASLVKAAVSVGYYHADTHISQQTSAYNSLVQANEYSGQERATGNAAFTADAVTLPVLRRMSTLVTWQDSYLDTFRQSGQTDEVAMLDKALALPASDQVKQMRETLLSNEQMKGYGVSPADWFTQKTAMINALYEIERAVAAHIGQSADDFVSSAKWNLIGGSVLCLVLLAATLVIWLLVAKSISAPLVEEVRVAETIISSNDFRHTVPETGPMEVVRTGQAFNTLVRNFREIIGTIKDSCGEIASSMHSLTASSQQLKTGSYAQASAASSVAAAIEQTSVSVSTTAANAEVVSQVSQAAESEATQAITEMADAVKNMQHLAVLLGSTRDQVSTLADTSVQISSFIEVIRSIADQTNLLALNASIEAARAGEQGRGFAVVADEVRKLAERTSQATGEIGTLITLIRERVQDTVTAMNNANDQASAGVTRIGNTEQALHRIGDGAREASAKVQEITDALNEQDKAIKQVVISMEEIAGRTEQTSASAEHNESITVALDRLSRQMEESVSKYQI